MDKNNLISIFNLTVESKAGWNVVICFRGVLSWAKVLDKWKFGTACHGEFFGRYFTMDKSVIDESTNPRSFFPTYAAIVARSCSV